jgi:ribose transport system substrate-binding protein
MKRFVYLGILLALALVLVGCNSAATEAPQEAGETAEVSAGEEAESVNPEDLTIAGLIHQEDQFGQMLKKGMEDAAADAGVNFVSSNYNMDDTKHIDLLNTYIAQNVDGIVSSIDENTGAIYEEAIEQGILVAGVNTSYENDFTTVQYSSDQASLGGGMNEYAINFINEQLDGKPVIHMLRLIMGNPIVNARGDAFLAGIEGAFGPEAAIPVSESAALDVAVAMQQVTDALTANPDINIIYAEAEPDGVGAIAAIETLGLEGQVFVFTTDCNEQMDGMLLDPESVVLQACSAQDPYYMGYYGTQDLIDTLLGVRTDFVLGENTIVPPTVLTKDNPEDVQAHLDMLQSFSGNE